MTTDHQVNGPQEHKRFPWLRFTIVLIAFLFLVAAAIVWINQTDWSPILTVIFAVLGVVLALLAWLFPLSPSEPKASKDIDVAHGSTLPPINITVSPNISPNINVSSNQNMSVQSLPAQANASQSFIEASLPGVSVSNENESDRSSAIDDGRAAIEIKQASKKEERHALPDSGSDFAASRQVERIVRDGGKLIREMYLDVMEDLQPEVMQTPLNSVFPYLEHLADPKEFYGRALEQDALIDNTHKGGTTSIVGQRRIGKTWLLEYLMRVAPIEPRLGPKYRIGYLDITSPSCATVSGFTFQALKQLGIRIPSNDAHLDLGVLEEAVRKLINKNRIPILCLDEFEGFGHKSDFNLNFFTGLRAICGMGLGLVVASGKPLIEFVGDEIKRSGYESSPFFNIFDKYTLQPFKTEEARKFVEDKGEQAKLTDYERIQLLKYGQYGEQQWPPLRLQLAGKMLLQDKGQEYYRSDDLDYWWSFKDRLENKYISVVGK